MTSPAEFASVYNDLDTYPKVSDVATKLGLNERTVRKKVKLFRQTGEPVLVSRKLEAMKSRFGFDPVLPGFQVSHSSVEQDESGNTVRTWIEQRPAEPGETFVMPVGQRIKNVSALLDPSDRVLAKWVKTKEDDAADLTIAALLDIFKDYKGHARPVRPPVRTNDEILTVYPVADLHYGMKANERETGQPYDRVIARARTLDMAQRLIAGSRPSQKAVLLGLGDLFPQQRRQEHDPAQRATSSMSTAPGRRSSRAACSSSST